MLNKKLQKFVDVLEQFLDSKGFNIGGDFITEKQEDILNVTQKCTRMALKKTGVDVTPTQIEDLYYEDDDKIYDFIFDELLIYVTNAIEEINRKTGAGLTNDQIDDFIDVLLSGRVADLDDQLEDVLGDY